MSCKRPPDVEATIEALIASGRFADREMVIAAGIDLLHQRQRGWLRRLWLVAGVDVSRLLALLYFLGLVAGIAALATGAVPIRLR